MASLGHMNLGEENSMRTADSFIPATKFDDDPEDSECCWGGKKAQWFLSALVHSPFLFIVPSEFASSILRMV
uniref:Uncharacterized protein n=1 Tax=Arundo donax TaxID=35708 RepID=A0A0A8ZTN2_ARUDO